MQRAARLGQMVFNFRRVNAQCKRPKRRCVAAVVALPFLQDQLGTAARAAAAQGHAVAALDAQKVARGDGHALVRAFLDAVIGDKQRLARPLIAALRIDRLAVLFAVDDLAAADREHMVIRI